MLPKRDEGGSQKCDVAVREGEGGERVRREGEGKGKGGAEANIPLTKVIGGEPG